MVSDYDLYELTPDMLPDIPEQAEFPDFAIRRGLHEYEETIRVDFLQISATKTGYLSLGLAVIAAAFQAKDVLLKLTSERTEYRVLSILGSAMNSVGRTDNQVVLKEFRYSPRQRSRHPFYGERLAEFPAFLLRCSGEETPSTDSWGARDTVEGFGRLEPSLLLAELLLDIARPSTSENEFVLEGPAGFQGVDPLSAEVRFWLPGSIGYSL
ncbi:MAG: hypothetical protein AAF689_04335 [Pseudomonadota bacterium]